MIQVSVISLVGLSIFVSVLLVCQWSISCPQWLRDMRSWKKDHLRGPTQPPYPGLLLFTAFELRASCERLARARPGLRDRAELQGWGFWDEPFERAMQLCLAAAAAGLSLFVGALIQLELPLLLVLVACATAAAWFDPPGRLSRRHRSATENCLEGMPSFIDGLVIALEAGQSLSRSLEVSLTRDYLASDLAWVSAIRQAHEDMKRGLGVEPAFARLRRVLPIPVVHRFSASCVLGETQGQSIAGVLRRQAEQCRREAHMAMEKRALQAPVKLMAPLMICIFPCTFVVLLAPLGRTLLSIGAS